MLTYDLLPKKPAHLVKEEHIEYGFIGKLQDLKYEYRTDIRDRAAQERNAFTSLDNLITAATQELDALKTHKKGLMQQLFPSPEAVEA